MTLAGPGDRSWTIDNASLSPLNWTPLIVGEPSATGEMEEALSDLTGAGHTAPKFAPAGFTTTTDLTIVFAADVGGSGPGDPTTEFHVTRGGSRTITMVHITGWTVAGESYIAKVKPGTPVAGVATLEVTFRWTGTVTVT